MAVLVCDSIFSKREQGTKKMLRNNVVAGNKHILKLRNGGGSVGNMYCVFPGYFLLTLQ